MKVLFCSFVFEKGGSSHLNTELIKLLANDNDVTVLSKKEFLTSDIQNLRNIKLIEHDSYSIRKGFSNVIGILRNMYEAAQFANKTKPDLIFVSVYETRTFAIGRFFFNKQSNLAILENNNIDHLDKLLNRLCYRSFAKKVKHFVFEGFIGDYIKTKFKVPKEKIFILPHCLYNNNLNFVYHCNKQKYQCIALSTSNNETIISKVISAEKDSKVLQKNNIHMFIKSKTLDFDDGYLIVKKGFIPEEEYNRLFNSCDVVYAPFSDLYKYRMSGCIIDSFSAHKRVVASRFMLAEEYSKMYPGLIYVVEEPLQVLHKICRLCRDNSFVDFTKFETDHSTDKIIQAVIDAAIDGTVKQV